MASRGRSGENQEGYPLLRNANPTLLRSVSGSGTSSQGTSNSESSLDHRKVLKTLDSSDSQDEQDYDVEPHLTDAEAPSAGKLDRKAASLGSPGLPSVGSVEESKRCRLRDKRSIDKITSSNMSETEKEDAYVRLAAKSFYLRDYVRKIVPDIEEELNARGITIAADTDVPGLQQYSPFCEPRAVGLQSAEQVPVAPRDPGLQSAEQVPVAPRDPGLQSSSPLQVGVVSRTGRGDKALVSL